MYKKIMIGLMVGALTVSVTGCTRFSEDVSEKEDGVEAAANEEEGLISKAENTMREFITAVNTQKYDGITDLVEMPENAFITDQNVEWYITRTALADITGVQINKLDINVKEGALKKTVEVYVNKEGYSFDMELDSDNGWRVVLPDLYVENWSLKIPKGCTATIAGKDLTDYKTQSSIVDDYDTYTFPAIAKQKFTVETVSSVYGSFTQEIKPTSDSEALPVICKLSDAETTSILKHIKDIWNGLYKDYTNAVGVDAVKKYFTDDFDNTEITNVMDTYFPQLETGPTDKDAGAIMYSNFYMTETIPWTKNNYGAAILTADNAVEVNFGYRIDFNAQTTGGSYSVRKPTTITLAYVDAPELGEGAKTYKIKKLNETKMFTDNDYETNDF